MGAENDGGKDLDPGIFTAEMTVTDYRAMAGSVQLATTEKPVLTASQGVAGPESLQYVDVPAEMRGMLGHFVHQNLAGDLVEDADEALCQKAGQWLASLLGFDGGLEVDVSFEGGNAVIVVSDDRAPGFGEMPLDRLHQNGLSVDHVGDTFTIDRNAFFAAMNSRSDNGEFPAGC